MFGVGVLHAESAPSEVGWHAVMRKSASNSIGELR